MIVERQRSAPIIVAVGLLVTAGLSLNHARRVRRAQPPDRCGAEDRERPVVHPRVATDVAVARAELEAAVANDDPSDGRFLLDAKLALIDGDLESYLASEVPTDLRFDGPRAAESVRQLADWIATQQARAKALRARYETIIAMNDPVASVVAAERVVRIARGTADTLYAAAIPAPVRQSFDAIDAYCDALTVAADPLDRVAVDAVHACIELARHEAIVDEHHVRDIVDRAQSCFDTSAVLAPEEFPMGREAVGSSIDELARLQLRIRNPISADVLGRATAYDRENARGIMFRNQDNTSAAEAAYRRAIAIDASRPEAYYNIALLLEWRALHPPSNLDDASELYREATSYLAASHVAATGALRREVEDELADVSKVVSQLDALHKAR